MRPMACVSTESPWLAFVPGGSAQAWPGSLTVMVVPGHNIEQTTPPVPDRLFLDAVCAWLNPRRLVTTEIFVRGPQYISLVVTIGLYFTIQEPFSIAHTYSHVSSRLLN